MIELVAPETVPAVVPPGVPHYAELHRTPDLSIGTYLLPAGGVDCQQPHTEDEVYVVLAGRARLTGPRGEIPVAPGSVVFVASGEEHRFVGIEEELRVAVVFGPAEHTRQPDGASR